MWIIWRVRYSAGRSVIVPMGVERCVQRCQLKLTPATRLLQFPHEVDKGNDGISSSTIFGPAARLSFGIMPFSDDEAIRYLGRDAYDQFINYN
jgi:hypothetical protein